jgi:hypothetical protein
MLTIPKSVQEKKRLLQSGSLNSMKKKKLNSGEEEKIEHPNFKILKANSNKTMQKRFVKMERKFERWRKKNSSNLLNEEDENKKVEKDFLDKIFKEENIGAAIDCIEYGNEDEFNKKPSHSFLPSHTTQ